MLEELSQLAGAGIFGVAIGQLIVLVVVLKLVFKLIGNHMAHDIEATKEQAEALKGLNETIKQALTYLKNNNHK